MCRKITEKMDSIEDSIEDVVRGMREDIGILKEEVRTLKNERDELRDENRTLERRVDSMENYSRRNNLIVAGIPQQEKETWEETELALKKILTTKLGLAEDAVQFDRVHRLRTKSTPQPIIARCTFYKDKETVLKLSKKLKGTAVYINEDFSPTIRTTRKHLGAHLAAAREQGKKAFLKFDHLVIDGVRWDLDTQTNSLRQKRTELR